MFSLNFPTTFCNNICQKCILRRQQHFMLRFLHFTRRKDVRVRFAPSPTGFLHIGGLRTALYNYLFAKSHKNGKFIIRIEDTDQSRFVPGATEHLLSILKWAGLDPDESPADGGDYGPYFQSKRLHHYTKHAHVLIANGSAYRCFCSPQRLMLLKRDQLLRKETPKYDNCCRYLTSDQIEENLSNEKPFVIRLKLLYQYQEFDDELYGHIKHNMHSEGDPVLLKSDGYPTYHLANVVDDHLMQISHVIRGREWLNSTPKHVLLYSAFGWKNPRYMHLPLLANQDGTKLSKRQNDVNVDYYKEQGYSPLPLLNFMVSCGSGFPDLSLPVLASSKESLLRKLSSAFKPETLLQRDATLDFKKLEDFSRTCTRHLIERGTFKQQQQMIHDLFDSVLKFFGKDCVFYDRNYTPKDVQDYILSIVNVRKGHIDKLNDLVSTDYEYLWIRPKFVENFDSKYRNVLDDIIDYLREMDWNSMETKVVNNELLSLAKSFQIAFPSLMKFLRVVFIGREEGPKIVDLITIFGKRETLWRLNRVQKQFASTITEKVCFYCSERFAS